MKQTVAAWAGRWALVPLLVCLGLPAWAQSAGPQRAALAPMEGEVIVAFKPTSGTLRKHALAARADAATVQSMLASRATTLGARVGRVLSAGAAVGEHVQVMRASGVDAATLARQLAADPDVAYAEPNGRKRFAAAPNDPLYAAATTGVRPNGPDSGQWYLRAPDSSIKSALDIEAAWLRTTGSANLVVAVLDTGVRFEHPDLGRVASGGRLLPGYDMVNDSIIAGDNDGRDADASDPGDFVSQADINADSTRAQADKRFATADACPTPINSSWHGTSTSSLIGAAANNALGMAGAAPGVRVLPVRVLGKCFGNSSDIIAGMRWAAGIPVPGVPDNPNPAKVLNLSLGGSGACTPPYQEAVNEVLARGTVIVAAAGNSAGGPVSEPANCKGVIGVLALRHAGTKVGFSDLGPEIAISAPGGNCINTAPGTPCLYPILAATNTGAQGPVASSWTNSFDITVGTSFSSPLVAGVMALMFSQQPALTPAQASTALQASARPFPTSGADNGPGDPSVVSACRAPANGVDQLQCYCPNDGSLCGAGMLDAGRAVTAVTSAVARIDVTTTTPTAGVAVALSASGSAATPGATLTQYAWTLVSGGGAVTGFSSATNASTATLLPSAAGTFTVQLQVTDGLGSSSSTRQTVVVAAAPAPAPAPVTGGGGGGAASGAWVAGVALAAAVLRALRRRA